MQIRCVQKFHLNHEKFANDIELISNNIDELLHSIEKLESESGKVNLKMNVNKTKV